MVLVFLQGCGHCVIRTKNSGDDQMKIVSLTTATVKRRDQGYFEEVMRKLKLTNKTQISIDSFSFKGIQFV